MNWIRVTVSPIINNGTYPPVAYGLFLSNDSQSVQYSHIPFMPGSVKIRNTKSTSIFIRNRGRQNDFNYWNDASENTSGISCSYRVRLAQSLPSIENNKVGYIFQIKYALVFRRLYPKEVSSENFVEEFKTVGPANKEKTNKLKVKDFIDINKLNESLLSENDKDQLGNFINPYKQGYKKCFDDAKNDVALLYEELKKEQEKFRKYYMEANQYMDRLEDRIAILSRDSGKLYGEMQVPLQESNEPLPGCKNNNLEEDSQLTEEICTDSNKIGSETLKENNLQPIKDYEIPKNLEEEDVKIENVVEPHKEPIKEPIEDTTRSLYQGVVYKAMSKLRNMEKELREDRWKELRKLVNNNSFDSLDLDTRAEYKVLKQLRKAKHDFTSVNCEALLEELKQSDYRNMQTEHRKTKKKSRK
jgi:hypothetical protein